MNAELVILSGNDYDEIQSLIPYMTEAEKAVVLREYPELLGSVVAAVATGIAAVTTGIIGAVSAKRRQKREAANQKALIAQQNAVVEKEITAQQALINATDRKNKIILFSAIGAGVLVVVVVMKKRSSRKNKKG
jgi:hypothetical protein